MLICNYFRTFSCHILNRHLAIVFKMYIYVLCKSTLVALLTCATGAPLLANLYIIKRVSTAKSQITCNLLFSVYTFQFNSLLSISSTNVILTQGTVFWFVILTFVNCLIAVLLSSVSSPVASWDRKVSIA